MGRTSSRVLKSEWDDFLVENRVLWIEDGSGKGNLQFWGHQGHVTEGRGGQGEVVVVWP